MNMKPNIYYFTIDIHGNILKSKVFKLQITNTSAKHFKIGDYRICFWSLQRQRNLLTRAWMWIADFSLSLCPLLSSLACLALSRNSDLALWGTLYSVHLGKKELKSTYYTLMIRMLVLITFWQWLRSTYLRFKNIVTDSTPTTAHHHIALLWVNLPAIFLKLRFCLAYRRPWRYTPSVIWLSLRSERAENQTKMKTNLPSLEQRATQERWSWDS